MRSFVLPRVRFAPLPPASATWLLPSPILAHEHFPDASATARERHRSQPAHPRVARPDQPADGPRPRGRAEETEWDKRLRPTRPGPRTKLRTRSRAPEPPTSTNHPAPAGRRRAESASSGRGPKATGRTFGQKRWLPWGFSKSDPRLRVAGLYAGSGADRTCAPPSQSTNDGVVVAGELSGLDFGFEFHTILLYVCVRTFETFGA